MKADWQRAHHIAGFDACFTRYVRYLLRQGFATVWIQREPPRFPPNGFIVAANHASWWDGFVPYAFHHLRPRRQRFAVLMSDAELRRFPFFRWGGAFSIDARSARRAREAIVYAGELAAGGCAVWIFPEGRIVEAGNTPARYSGGFVHAARSACVPIVPAAMRFVMRAKQRPEAYLAFGTPIPFGGANAIDRTRDAINTLLVEIERANPSLYVPMLQPAPGVDARVAALLGALRPE